MSSLTTTSSMEESPEEYDTRLCLGIGGGSRWPPLQINEKQEPDGAYGRSSHRPEAPGGRNKGRSTTTTRGGASAATRRNKKARTRGGDNGDHRSESDGGDAAGVGARTKLRLTGEQAALLEESFRAHNILSHGEKHDLARRLRLSARQVEVWFQNRRARTKLKQTELDCELLRRLCQRLSDDNARLRRELAEARSSSSAAVPRLTMAGE